MEDIKTEGDLLKVFNFTTAQVPIIEENLIINTRTPWVYYGIANMAPQELIRLYNSSPTHRAAVQSKWYGVRGEELSILNGDNDRLVMANSLGDSFYDIWMKCALDFILYGAFALNIVWRKDREMGFDMYYMDCSKLRAEKSDLYDKVHHYYYSADWAFPKRFIPRKLAAFDPTNEEDTNLLITKEVLQDMINRIDYKFETNIYLKKYLKHRIEEIVELNKLLYEDDD